jgi:hypothetical protein
MRIQCEGAGQRESKSYIFGASEIESALDMRRVEGAGDGKPHECDQCGKITPDVDLWAKNSETGDELWLCMACGEW